MSKDEEIKKLKLQLKETREVNSQLSWELQEVLDELHKLKGQVKGFKGLAKKGLAGRLS